MRRHQEGSPLSSDPAGREDIMSDEPREEDSIPGATVGSPVPHNAAHPEGAVLEEPGDETVTGG